MIVVIDGPTGSGKSTIGKYLAKKFKLRFISAGEIFRKMADENGYDSEDPKQFQRWHKITEADLEFDRKLDERMAAEAKKGNCIVQGRIAAFFVENYDIAFFIKVDSRVAALRVGQRDRQPLKEAMRTNRNRDESNRKRYKELYDINYLSDMSPYNFVVDTSHFTIREECDVIEMIVRFWRDNKKKMEKV
jgi:cytidylate kinase